MNSIVLTNDYMTLLKSIKSAIQAAHIRAHLAVNKELIILYWHIGNEILNRKKELGWGADVIKTLAQDLKHEFPNIKGFGERNLVYMQTFAGAYPDFQVAQQLAAQIPWFHHCVILDKIKDHALRIWYIEKTIEHGWSRNVLVMQIENQTHLKLGIYPLPIILRILPFKFINHQRRKNSLNSWLFASFFLVSDLKFCD